MEMMSGSSGVLGRFCETDFGSWTSTPWCRSGAVTMKMTRSTSMTSTSGVTLMSEKASASSSSLKAMRRPSSGEVALGQVHELEGEVAHFRTRRAHPAAEVVVRDEGGNGRDEAGGGVDGGLGDPRRHHDDRRRALLGDLRERDHDAHHGAEEADERRRRGRGREKRQPPCEARRLDTGRALEGPFNGREALHEEAPRVGRRHFAAVLHLLVELGVTRAKNSDERARLALVADAEDVGELAALAEVLQEYARVGRSA